MVVEAIGACACAWFRQGLRGRGENGEGLGGMAFVGLASKREK